MSRWRLLICLGALCGPANLGAPAGFLVSSFERNGTLAWTNAFAPGVCTIEMAEAVSGPWQPLKSVFTTGSSGALNVPLSTSPAFYRLFAADVSGTPQGFTNLGESYSLLRTIAGNGAFGADRFNGWQTRFEGGPATDAALSRPHIAMADDAGNIFIADKDAHAIRQVTPAGRIYTVAGMNEPGDDGDAPGPGTQRRFSSPNGLWVRGDGTLYILDLDNGKIRRLDTNGVMTTLFTVGGGIDTGRGLWVKDDETLAYFASGNSVKKWTPSGGVKTFASGFVSLGNFAMDPGGKLVVTDRGGNRVYRLSNSGNKTAMAGNGGTTGGGDGALAKDTGLYGVRGVWFLPNGGYFLATHEGCQIWYVDVSGMIHLFVDGQPNAHSGDGENFRTPGFKVSEVRAVTMDKDGNLIITESDFGFIRKIDFRRGTP